MGFWNREHRSETHTYRPWRLVTLVLGIAAMGLGGWALVRTGLPLNHMFRPERVVVGMHHTPALAVAEIVAGAVLVVFGLSVVLGRIATALVGTASAAFGALMLVRQWDGRLRHWTAVTDANAWVYLAAG